MKLLKFDRKEFDERFGNKKKCYKYLAEKKWFEGYSCKQCSSERYIKGKQPHSRRCSKCGYDESPTAGTLFHKLKFDLDKAFGMLYEIATSKKGANSVWLAERFGVQQNTAWLFRQKVQNAMKSSGKHPLEGEVYVDEFEIGTPEEGKQGRAHSEKKMRVVIAIEFRDGKVGRGYGKYIADYSNASLKPIFSEHILKDAFVKTDKWAGYGPQRHEYPLLEQILSENGSNFKMLHNQIRNFKNWLRGVHSYCDKEYLQRYIDEYFYRFNRRNHRETILDKLLERCIHINNLTKRSLNILAI